jgi:hypothetical protein
MAEKEPATVLHLLAEMAETDPPFSNQFVEEFCGRLQGQSPALATVQSWVQHRLAEQGLTRELLQRADNQTQAADQVSIGNSIGSLRFLSAMDWREFVEALSVIEHALRADPAGVYAQMDFVTRAGYRHCVEAMARSRGRRTRCAATVNRDQRFAGPTAPPLVDFISTQRSAAVGELRHVHCPRRSLTRMAGGIRLCAISAHCW